MTSMWAQVGFVLLFASAALGASLPPCPDRCDCKYYGDILRVSCESFPVFGKLQPKQTRLLETLVVKNQFVREIDPKLKVLRNLKELDLSGNEISTLQTFPQLPYLQRLNLSSNAIRSFSAIVLPYSLVSLDLSSNHISELPKDLTLFKNLRQLNVSANPISCTCDVLSVRDALKKSRVNFAEPVLCAYPEEYRGKSWYTEGICNGEATKNIWDVMQGDEPQFDGSGSGEVDEDSATGRVGVFEEDIENEYIPDVDRARTAPKTDEDDVDYDGSGDKLIDDFYKMRPKACHINCSTPPPIDDNNDTDSTPVGGFDVLKILAEDISGKSAKESSTTEKQQRGVALSSAASTEIPVAVESPAVEVVLKSDTNTPYSTVAEPAKQSNSVYILLAVLGAALILLIVYAVMSTLRKKEARRRNLQSDADKKPYDGMTELQPLKKTPPAEKTNNVSERVPLMNGQNGTQNGTSYDEPDAKDANSTAPASADKEYVEYRQKHDKNGLLTPETKRVTIRAGEIPGSVPRTPLLVERHITTDGNVITTPSMDQRI